MRKRVFLCALAFIVFGAGSVWADDVAELKKEIEKQYEILQKMQQRIVELEARQKAQDTAIKAQDTVMTERIAEEVEKRESEAAPLDFSLPEGFRLSGDFRYRHETIEEENNNKPDQQRNRIRLRLMVEAMINNEWDVAFRIASGSADPASTNQTLDNSFSSKDLFLDLAYVRYRPEGIEGLDVYAGKVKNPFYKPGKTQLIWDSDLNPEGGSFRYTGNLSDADSYYINGGAFWVDENSGGVDTSLFGIQSYLRHAFADGSYVLGGASYFDYGNIAGRGNLKSTWSSSGSFFGNTTKAGGTEFKSDYDLFEGFGEYGFKVMGMPVMVFGDYVKNIASATSEDTGWLIGVKLNKASKPGSWEFAYDYRDLEADAVLGAFSSSDFLGGGTDGKGHKFGFRYQLARNLQAGLAYILAEERRASDEDDYRRLQLDLIYKF